MRFSKITMGSGGLFLERRASAPVYTQQGQGRIFYDQTEEQAYYGCDRTDIAGFIPLFDSAHDLIPEAGSTYNIGSLAATFAAIYADALYGALTGNVIGNITGDVKAPNGDTILNNGTSIAAGDAQFFGDIHSANGSRCLNNGGTPSAATFLGTSTYALYA